MVDNLYVSQTVDLHIWKLYLDPYHSINLNKHSERLPNMVRDLGSFSRILSINRTQFLDKSFYSYLFSGKEYWYSKYA